ncbi:heparanase [Epargyreus clarus]|uniref:heparanase n=1 Tax=Epargyreus clarus TaxID=520877 RepID=UPI003C2AE22D
MDRILTLKVILIAKFLTILSPVQADTYSVKIGTESHINLVDSRFLSFTIDPKYLFSSSGKYNTKECICMASSLTPAYIRIAGPSTSHTTFHNSTISIDALKLLDDGNAPQKISLNEYQRENIREKLQEEDQVSVTHEEWEKFVQWAKKTGFDLVFALNNDEKTPSGMWDPNTALNILTVAEKANIGDIFWQLGYECNNQSIEEYLNDLETLRVITETFPSGKDHWRVVGGDVTPCLAADSKSDFKDYVALSDEMFDAVFLNGNSSSQELQRMSEKDRLKLLKVLSRSKTPLWLTETNNRVHELERAADWMTSLGYSAQNGFSVHFRELVEVELYEPTLSFYMALLFKNLVGEKVLNVDIEASEATMFAHCTSLRHKAVPGAVTLYGANMDVEPARFSIKLSKKEEGGDIMQFILGHDHNGNIVVNGRAMYYEGDIKPVVKRVRPYKTLLINLPPKSFGFWVLANTQVDACYDIDEEQETQYVEAVPIENENDYYSSIRKSKRSVDFQKKSPKDLFELLNRTDLIHEKKLENKVIENSKNDLNDVINNQSPKPLKQSNTDDITNINSTKGKRQTSRLSERRKNLRRFNKEKNEDLSSILGSNLIAKLRNRKVGRKPQIERIRVSKRNSRGPKRNLKEKIKKVNILDGPKRKVSRKRVSDKLISDDQLNNPDCDSLRKRKRRSIKEDSRTEEDDHTVGNHVGKKFRNLRNIIKNNIEEETEDTIETEINEDGTILPVGNILRKLQKISSPVEIYKKHKDNDLEDNNEDYSDEDEFVLKTKLLDNSAVINISDKTNHGFFRSTIDEALSMLADLNKNLNKVWSALTFLE